jgi:mRNA-degrading endonuclease HigB of HigAB toxin-antitoxin module
MGSSLYIADNEINTTRDIYNYTESKLIWNNIEENIKNSTSLENLKEYDINEKRILNVLGRGLDFIGYASYEVSKFFIEIGYAHPEVDYKFILNCLIKLLILIIILTLIPLVMPILAIICILYQGISTLIKKIHNKKKK